MTTPEVLYHYTTADGLLGIIGSTSLWATDVGFLNDVRELGLAKSALRQHLVSLADTLDPSPDLADEAFAWSEAAVARATVQLIDQPDARNRERPWLGAFVTCFCDHEDLLSQWRGYGKRGGYALGFDATAIASLAALDASDPAPQLIQVRYGNGEVSETVNRFKQAWEDWESPTLDMGYVRYAALVLPALASIKDEAFAEEREWRLLITTDVGQSRLRSGEYSLTPYAAVPFPVQALRRIVVGPGEHLDVRLDGVRRLLATLDEAAHVEVVASTVPYRG